MAFNQIMVDLESTGTDASHSAIIQLSAVKFDLENMTIDGDMFDQCLLIPGNRFWMEDTRDWWGQQEPHILQNIWGRMRDPGTVMKEFSTWAGVGAVLWAKPVSFEQPFLQSYFRDFGVNNPFHYSESQDLRSWCRARGMPNLDRELPFSGTAHNALDDVIHQIAVLFTLLEKTNVVL